MVASSPCTLVIEDNPGHALLNSMTPHALIIEDIEAHQHIAADLLEQAGFTVSAESTLLSGVEHALALLDPAQPPRPMLILLDLMLPHERSPALEGIIGAAYLTERMEAGELHLAHIVAITGEPTAQREYEARAVGCERLIGKPLTAAHALSLSALVQTPPRLPTERELALPEAVAASDRALRLAICRQAAQSLPLLRSVDTSPLSQQTPIGTVTWDADTVQALFSDPADLQIPWRDWLNLHGGVDHVRTRLLRVPLTLPLLRDVRAQFALHGDDWRMSARNLGIERSAYYARLDKLFREFAVVLNSWI